MSEALSFEFPAPVLKDAANEAWSFHYVPIPPAIAEALIEAGLRRVILNVDGREAGRYLHQNRDGEYRIIVGLSTLRDLGLKPGEVFVGTLRPDPDPDRVDIPDEFLEAMSDHPGARKRFESWTPGKQRSLVSYITQAKREETRWKRAYEMAHKLETYTLYGDKKPEG